MATKNFADELGKVLDFSNPSTDPFNKKYSDLSEIVQQVQDEINKGLKGEPIQLILTPGFQSSIGQQVSIELHIPKKDFQVSLFRAYIALDGSSVHLDFFDEEKITCQNKQKIQDEILMFLKEIKSFLDSYRSYASQ